MEQEMKFEDKMAKLESLVSELEKDNVQMILLKYIKKQ